MLPLPQDSHSPDTRYSILDTLVAHVIDPAIAPLRVAGGSPGWPVAGLFNSALHSVLNAVLHSALRDQFSHLSSTQSSTSGGRCSALPHRLSHLSSVIDSVIHSALPEAARSARSADPTSRQCPEITKNDEPRTKNSLEQPYVVTRSRPYLRQS